MITFNILCVTTFKSLLGKILEWRKKYNTDDVQLVRFDTPYLKEPLQYDMNILPKDEFMFYMQESLDYIKNNVDDADLTKFNTVEYEKFRRVVDYMGNSNYADDMVEQGRKDFYNWFTALDERRGTNFVETFPELEDFFNECKELNG
jgi:hypothetical protein